jgi:hypothetical protein
MNVHWRIPIYSMLFILEKRWGINDFLERTISLLMADEPLNFCEGMRFQHDDALRHLSRQIVIC